MGCWWLIGQHKPKHSWGVTELRGVEPTASGFCCPCAPQDFGETPLSEAASSLSAQQIGIHNEYVCCQLNARYHEIWWLKWHLSKNPGCNVAKHGFDMVTWLCLMVFVIPLVSVCHDIGWDLYPICGDLSGGSSCLSGATKRTNNAGWLTVMWVKQK